MGLFYKFFMHFPHINKWPDKAFFNGEENLMGRREGRAELSGRLRGRLCDPAVLSDFAMTSAVEGSTGPVASRGVLCAFLNTFFLLFTGM